MTATLGYPMMWDSPGGATAGGVTRGMRGGPTPSASLVGDVRAWGGPSPSSPGSVFAVHNGSHALPRVHSKYSIDRRRLALPDDQLAPGLSATERDTPLFRVATHETDMTEAQRRVVLEYAGGFPESGTQFIAAIGLTGMNRYLKEARESYPSAEDVERRFVPLGLANQIQDFSGQDGSATPNEWMGPAPAGAGAKQPHVTVVSAGWAPTFADLVVGERRPRAGDVIHMCTRRVALDDSTAARAAKRAARRETRRGAKPYEPVDYHFRKELVCGGPGGRDLPMDLLRHEERREVQALEFDPKEPDEAEPAVVTKMLYVEVASPVWELGYLRTTTNSARPDDPAHRRQKATEGDLASLSALQRTELIVRMKRDS